MLIALEIALPYQDFQARDFMFAAENCGGSCLLDIQPGTTHVGDAKRLLQSNPWVSDVQQDAAGNGYAEIRWGWSGQQPAIIDTTRQGRITFYWENEAMIRLDNAVVETVTIYTNMRHFSLQNLLGESAGGSAAFRPDGKLGYSVLYDIHGGVLNLYGEIDCPFKLMSYWNTHTRITLSIGRTDTGYVDPTQLSSVCNQPHD